MDTVILSEAKAPVLEVNVSVINAGNGHCHPERSEGSHMLGIEILR